MRHSFGNPNLFSTRRNYRSTTRTLLTFFLGILPGGVLAAACLIMLPTIDEAAATAGASPVYFSIVRHYILLVTPLLAYGCMLVAFVFRGPMPRAISIAIQVGLATGALMALVLAFASAYITLQWPHTLSAGPAEDQAILRSALSAIAIGAGLFSSAAILLSDLAHRR